MVYVIDSIVVNEKNPNDWDLLIQYRAFLTIPLGSLIAILVKSKRNRS